LEKTSLNDGGNFRFATAENLRYKKSEKKRLSAIVSRKSKSDCKKSKLRKKGI